MLGHSPNQNQKSLFLPLMSEFIDPQHELVRWCNAIDWGYFEYSFSKFYASTGHPSMPIRFMVGCLLLKRHYNLCYEALCQEWTMNPYMQYFCGEAYFQHRFPCNPGDFPRFKKRIGDKGMEDIFSMAETPNWLHKNPTLSC